MKIGFYCESPADRAAMTVFVEARHGESPEPINMNIEARSMPAFFDALGGGFRGMHYQSDAEALVIVGDADETAMHTIEHQKAGNSEEGCRLCKAHRIIAQARRQLKPRSGRRELRVAIGMAFPSVESW
jgi:hypothetical protein